VVHVDAAAVGAIATTLEPPVAAGAVCFVTPVKTGIFIVTSVFLLDAAAAVTPELVLAAGLCAVCFVTPVKTVMMPVTSPLLLPEAAAAVTPELVLAAGLCAVSLVAAVSTVVPSVAHIVLHKALPLAGWVGAAVNCD